MRKFLVLAFCLALSPAWALSLNDQSKQEARLFNQFLKAVYAQRADDSSAFSELEKTLRLSPDSKYLKRMLVAQALADGEAEKAAPYVNFIEQGENDAEDWLVYGAYQLKKNNLPEAEKAYDKALALDPDNARVLYQYVLVLSLTNLDKAVEKLIALAQENPDLAPAVYTEIGSLYFESRRMNEAVLYYNKASALAPDDPNPRLGRGEVYEKTSQYFLMLHEFEELEKMGYSNAGTLSRMASVYLMSNDLPKAEEYFLKAKADDNGDVPSAYFLARLAEQRGDYSRAISYLRDSSDYNRSADKWLQVSFYLQRLNQNEESLKTLQEAYKKFDGNVEIAYFYALALSERAEYKKAAKVFKKLLETNPSYEEARLQYAFTLDSLKKYSELDAQLEILLEQNPKNAPALNLYAYSLAQRNTRLADAQEYIARALAMYPDENAFIDTQAWIYFRQGKYQQSAELLSVLSPEFVKANPDIAYHWGAVLYELGDYEKARPYLQSARESIQEADKLYKKLPKQK